MPYFNTLKPALVPLTFIGVLVSAVLIGLVYMPGPHNEDKRIILKRGASLRAVAGVLDEAGAVRSAFLFRLYVRLNGQAGALKAGEFDMRAKANMPGLLTTLVRGDVVLHKITFAEGLTSQQIIAQVRNEDVLSGTVDVPAEGSLLPETYNVPRGMSRAALVKQMQQAQKAALDALWPQRQKGLPVKTKQEALILASIVERETGLAKERPLVAAVFTNRLRKGMRLQSDPTIIYGLVGGQGKLGRPIRRSEIRRKTPYNTYRINGLPPTPIANPGRASIAAVLNPVASKALYFVADGTGGHVFAETLSGHNKNVRRWREIEKQRKR